MLLGALTLWLSFCATSTALARPTITGHWIYDRATDSRAQVATESPYNTVPLELQGSGFLLSTTNGYTFFDDVQVRMRYANDDAWLTLGRTGWAIVTGYNSYALSVQVAGVRPGYLEFQVCQRTGECSDTYFIEVKPEPSTARPAGAPEIRSMYPAWDVARTSPSSYDAMGSGFLSTTRMYVRYANRDAWTESTPTGSWIQVNGWNSSQKSFTALGTRPGYLQVVACNDVCSNYGYVRIQPRFRTPARFVDTVHKKTVVTDPSNASARMLWFRRESMNGDNDVIWVDGVETWTGGRPADAWGYTYVPFEKLSSPGLRYMWLRTDAGWSSNYARLEVWGLPNGSVSPSAAAVTSDYSVQIDYASEYAAPTSTTAVISSATCSNVTVPLSYVSTTARRVTIPTACLGGFAGMNVQIATTNFAGTGVANFWRSKIELIVSPIPSPFPKPFPF